MVFVGNGYDLDRFRPERKRLDQLGFSIDATGKKDSILFATVARWNAQKDQRNLIDACQELVLRLSAPFVCLLIGPNMNEQNEVLMEYIKQRKLSQYVVLCGSTTDVPAVMNAIDFHVLPSAFGEAYPNVVAEAMACSTPCIVTDVGDAADMVGSTGWVVPPKDPIALAEAILAVMSELGNDHSHWNARKQASRTRAIEKFDIHKMIKDYQNVWFTKNA